MKLSCQSLHRPRYIREKVQGGIEEVNRVVKGVVVGGIIETEYAIPELCAFVCSEEEALRELMKKVDPSNYLAGTRVVVTKVLEAAAGGGRMKAFKLVKGQAVTRRLLSDNSEVLKNAAGGGHVDIVKLLLKGGHVDINADDGVALRRAASYGHADVVQLIVAKGALVNLMPDNAEGTRATALFLACQEGHGACVKVLLACPKVDAFKEGFLPKSNSGDSPLAIAVKKGHADVVKLLVDHVAAALAKAKRKRTDGGATEKLRKRMQEDWYGALRIAEKMTTKSKRGLAKGRRKSVAGLDDRQQCAEHIKYQWQVALDTECPL